MSNTINIQGNKVVKTFGSRMSYVRELSIYEKVKGLELAPEITGKWDGSIEHEFIEGKNFNDVYMESLKNPYDFLKYTKLFLDWYLRFRSAVKLSVGDMDFSDFIIADDHLYCIDFEHCRPAGVEQDVAYLASLICFYDHGYSLIGIENAKIFVKTCFESMDISSEKLYHAIKKALEDRCLELDIPLMEAANEYLACFVCCSFVHSPGSGSPDNIQYMVDALNCSKHMWTLFADDVSGENEKILRYLMGSRKADYDVLILTDKGNIKTFPLLIRTADAALSFDMQRDSGLSVKEILISKFRCKGMPVEKM